jgi:hypothetical protein
MDGGLLGIVDEIRTFISENDHALKILRISGAAAVDADDISRTSKTHPA